MVVDLCECLGLRAGSAHSVLLRDHLVELAMRANIGNPGLPTKYVEPDEICPAQYSDSSLEEISL